ncbi:sugar transporter [Sphingomonas sp. Leaf412]|uniref:MFS transporter n=1 Tax=Sphingomonas sp. Leaf412 TaxID=1736370 RepID=UPI0006FB70E5|nr:MFS transporter [Sphingomonas sp. Leaf412]KQT31434.1 sugar transporter [Sphingomonas sp. Leaf412]
MERPRLSLPRIVEMNLGFLGLQFSFGLQQANMGPIYGYLGADEASLPLLWLAGPVTGLLVQPLIGAMSDRTSTRLGRRTPYFLVGAMLCSLCLFAMPYSPTLWIAASLLWILDAANNVTMEPYRAYIGDRLREDQRAVGFLTQSAFTGLAQTLSYLSPSLLVWAGFSKDAVDANGIPDITRIAFVVGAVLSLSTIVWSVMRVPELPLPPEEQARLDADPLTFRGALSDLRLALVEMPRPMRQLALAMLCQWYAMFAYWQFIAFAVARRLYGTGDAGSAGFRDAVLTTGQLGAFYNAVAFVAALALMPLAKRFGAKHVHAVCLAASGVAMLAIPNLATEPALFVAMLGIGIGWASMMGNPYIMLTGMIPPERYGVYMGIFNMFIVIPMMIESLTVPLFYHRLLAGDPGHVIALGGVLMLLGAVATVAVRERGLPAPAL